MTIEASIFLKRNSFALHADFTLNAPGITVVTGPSGAGKTALLRCLAGLEESAQGKLTVCGKVWQDNTLWLPVYQRPIGYIFQDARLFPHLDIEDNLRYGLRRASADMRHFNMTDVINWLGLDRLLARMPEELSGGEKQRVALGRALLISPHVLLMDEPLTGLDRESCHQLLEAIKFIAGETGIIILYVCHAEDEIIRIADNILYLEQGKIAYHGNAADALLAPLLPYIHRENPGMLIAGKVKASDAENSMMHIDTLAGPLHIPGVTCSGKKDIRITLRANDLSISLEKPSGSSIANIIQAVIQAMDAPANPALNGVLNIFLDAHGQKLLARITKKSVKDLALREGMQVFLQLKAVAAQVV